MSERRTVRSLAALAVVLAVAVVGCSDPAKPKPLPSASAAPSSSAPASPAPPTMPPAARGTSAASAKAFGVHYVDLINYAMATGDTKPVSELSLPRCTTCSAIARGIDNVYAKSGRLKGDGWKVRRAFPAVSTDNRSARVSLRIRVTKQIAYAPSASPSVSRPNDGQLEMTLLRQGGGWVVERLDATE